MINHVGLSINGSDNLVPGLLFSNADKDVMAALATP